MQGEKQFGRQRLAADEQRHFIDASSSVLTTLNPPLKRIPAFDPSLEHAEKRLTL